MRKTMRTAVIGAAAALAICGLTGAAGAAAAGDKPPLDNKPVSPEGDPIAAAAKAYLTVYPGMTQADAEKAARQQDMRKALHAKLVAGTGATTFGGAWFDPPTGTVHVNATTEAARKDAAKAATELGLKVATHKVARSFDALEAKAEKLRTGDSAVAQAAQGSVGIDVKTNTVVASVPKAKLAGLKDSTGPAVKLVAKTQREVEADAGCTSRSACDYTIRAGAIMWRGSLASPTPWCSVGFTGRQTNNARWVLTAGHCSTGNGVMWGTGSQNIGPMYASINSGAYDVGLIQVTNSWFASDQGGEIYQTAYVNGVAPSLSYIWAGDTVCLSANFTNPTGGNFCGVVGTNSDAGTRGMVRVDGLDACGGDSGGGWYWLTSTGRRIAYGLHSRSDLGCHGDSGGSRSWFTSLPTAKNWVPWVNVEYRP